MKHSILAAVVCALSAYALAASGGHDDHSIPMSAIVFQVINFGLFVTILVVLLKGKVATYFRTRAQDFTVARNRAAELKAAAEQQKRDIEAKLRHLESTAKQTVENARKEALALKASILREAEEMAEKIRKEAEQTARSEVERAKEELRQSLLSEAIEAAKNSVSKNLSASDQKRLQGEFVEKIQAVKQ